MLDGLYLARRKGKRLASGVEGVEPLGMLPGEHMTRHKAVKR